MIASDNDIAITPDFNNSALTLGPTFISGTLFRETAIALSFSIVVSSFVALTLSPMLASKFLNKKNNKNFAIRKFEKFFLGFSKFYQETLEVLVKRTKTISLFIIFIIIASVLLFNFSKKESFLVPA